MRLREEEQMLLVRNVFREYGKHSDEKTNDRRVARGVETRNEIRRSTDRICCEDNLDPGIQGDPPPTDNVAEGSGKVSTE